MALLFTTRSFMRTQKTVESATPISAARKIINLFGVGSPDSSGFWLFRLSDL